MCVVFKAQVLDFHVHMIRITRVKEALCSLVNFPSRTVQSLRTDILVVQRILNSLSSLETSGAGRLIT